ncbi:tRNA lysidine(34) synthetase TilS [Thiobacillus denitrificans]|uniref:tRNA lysidine(34) synthetase TilS n=1 Tax=Thiobacillus denitrificans TaxID=36861 RepID=UPI001EE4DBF7|nr:tRNA lysidine(34) synthetase TilS [Thiobacillus denitrificans]
MAASRKPLPGKAPADAVGDALARHVFSGARLVLALSGGLDSVVLLHVLASLRGRHRFALAAVHVHHGLSPHASDWADFCERLCAAHALDLQVERVHIAGDDPAGTEAAARRERHRVFARLDADFVLTAHHLDDQAETVLLQLLRGAGPKGLAAMPQLRRPAGWRAAQLRPLLDVSRRAIRAHAQRHGLAWVEDESNLDLRYRRNALRRDIMPRLAAHFPGSAPTLARAAALQAEAAGLLDDLAALDAQGAVRGDRLDCAALAALSAPRARNLLRHFIEGRGCPLPSARVLDEARLQLVDARHDARVRVNLKAAELWRFRGHAYVVSPAPAPAPAVYWHGEQSLWVPGAGCRVEFRPTTGHGLKRGLLTSGTVTLDVRRGGERLRLHPGGPHRSLKNLLQEAAVPPWQRARLPLLYQDGQLVWAAGIGFDPAFGAAPGEAGVMPHVVSQAAAQDSGGCGVLS